MKDANNVCYADTRIGINVGKSLDIKVKGVLNQLAVLPAYVKYDLVIEARAYSHFIKKYDRPKARALACFCATVLGYFLYEGNSLNWAIQEAESKIRA